MRFKIQNLMWLTFAVAAFAGVARILGVTSDTIGYLLIACSYLFAPLLLTLLSSFFQNINPKTRWSIGYIVLAISFGVPALAMLIFPPALFLWVPITATFWAPQIDVFDKEHGYL